MKKKDVLKIAALAVIAIFVLQYASMLDFLNPPKNTENEYYSIITVLSASIDYYERYLYTDNLDYEKMEWLKSNGMINEITQEQGVYKITLKKKEYVGEIYSLLLNEGIETYANARIILQPDIELDSKSNYSSAYFYTRKIKIEGIVPIFPEGSEIQVVSQVYILGEQAFQDGPVEIYTENKEIIVNSKVIDYEYVTEYTVPWEKRNSINLVNLSENYGEENILFEKQDQIVFSSPLGVSEQIIKKFDYVEYITADYAIVHPEFSDKEKVKYDFGENTIFPDSLLIIKSNDSIYGEFSSKNYNLYYSEIYFAEEYYVSDELKNQAFVYDKQLQINETVEMNANVMCTGNNILEVNELEIVTE
ncbi:MAG: hypothetical protein PHU63_03440 [Candidatus ainarchaeum sp.]|nr:hypothetical protein [Candidatus ainarchaeum sp.]